MRLSLLELPTLIRRALLVAGIERGTVDAAAALVVWCELARGDGLVWLEAQLPALAQPLPAAPCLGTTCETAALVAGAGGSLLLIGPAALDLAVEKARRRGAGTVLVAEAAHLAIAGALAAQAAQRGLVGIALAHGTAPAESGSTVVCPSADPAVPDPVRIDWRGMEPSAAFLAWSERLRSACWDGAPPRPQAIGALIEAALAPAPKEASPGLVLLCLDPRRCGDASEIAQAILCAARGATIRGLEIETPTAASQRRHRQTEEGIAVDDALWRRLRAYGDRVLMPTSEESRRGAG